MFERYIQIPLPRLSCLAIYDGIGCSLRVRRGDVWLTTDADAMDAILKPGERTTLATGTRTVLSTFEEAATIAVYAPRGARPLAFAFREDGNERVLNIVRRTSALATVAESLLAPFSAWRRSPSSTA